MRKVVSIVVGHLPKKEVWFWLQSVFCYSRVFGHLIVVVIWTAASLTEQLVHAA